MPGSRSHQFPQWEDKAVQSQAKFHNRGKSLWKDQTGGFLGKKNTIPGLAGTLTSQAGAGLTATALLWEHFSVMYRFFPANRLTRGLFLLMEKDIHFTTRHFHCPQEQMLPISQALSVFCRHCCSSWALCLSSTRDGFAEKARLGKAKWTWDREQK